MNLNPFKKKKAAEPVVEAAPVREHRGQGARKAARRKFRHKLLNEKIKQFRDPKYNLSPAGARFHARVAVDIMLSEGAAPNAHGRGLVR
jgi:hypothetical protein